MQDKHRAHTDRKYFCSRAYTHTQQELAKSADTQRVRERERTCDIEKQKGKTKIHSDTKVSRELVSKPSLKRTPR